MNLHRTHTEILMLAIAAALILLLYVSMKAPQAKIAAPQVSSQTYQPASIQRAPAPASLHVVSAQTTGDWVRAETIDTPIKQTRWVF